MLAPVGLRFGSLRPDNALGDWQPRTPEPSEAQPRRGEHRNGAGQPRRLKNPDIRKFEALPLRDSLRQASASSSFRICMALPKATW
jgi:hypothetical protein